MTQETHDSRRARFGGALSRPGRPGMDLEFLARVRKSAIITGGVLALPIASYWGLAAGGAWIAGVAWSLVNLHFITAVVRSVITADERIRKRIIGLVLIKFPVLYGVGFLLLWPRWLPAAGLVAGFSWPFAVLFLKAAGRVWLKLDETSIDDGGASRA